MSVRKWFGREANCGPLHRHRSRRFFYVIFYIFSRCVWAHIRSLIDLHLRKRLGFVIIIDITVLLSSSFVVVSRNRYRKRRALQIPKLTALQIHARQTNPGITLPANEKKAKRQRTDRDRSRVREGERVKTWTRRLRTECKTNMKKYKWNEEKWKETKWKHQHSELKEMFMYDGRNTLSLLLDRARTHNKHTYHAGCSPDIHTSGNTRGTICDRKHDGPVVISFFSLSLNVNELWVCHLNLRTVREVIVLYIFVRKASFASC